MTAYNLPANTKKYADVAEAMGLDVTGETTEEAAAACVEGLRQLCTDVGISLLPELMVRHSPTPIKVCHAPLHFYRTIGIGVKDKKALSNSTRLFVDYVRTWVAENGDT